MSKEKLQSAEAIGALIRTTRKAQGLSQAELAGVANTGVRFISDLENGKGTIQLRKLLKSSYPIRDGWSSVTLLHI